MTKTNTIFKRIVYGLSVLALVIIPVAQTTQASAAQITARSVTLGSSVFSATTTYSFQFTVPSATVIQSASFDACTTASGACSIPSGFSVTGTTLTAQPTNLGDASGWTVNTSTAGSLRLAKSGNVATPTGAQTVGFSGVTNPSATNSTFFVRMTTYSTATWTTPIDTGTVASSTAGQITVNATVDEALTFTLAQATVTLSPSSITTAAASTGTSTLVASTNAVSGYSITYSSPNTLKPVGGTALPSYSSSASAPGTAGFGINLKANTTPAIGSNASGGSGAAVGAYNTADQFTFVGGNVATQIASAGAATNATTYVVSYVANIAALTPAGAYTTTFTYVATPNF
ncbi:hypothetical protein BH10PAT4_BH10PAT4_1020 [soil metagenome]